MPRDAAPAPADTIRDAGAALADRLLSVARRMVREAGDGAVTVADVVAALEALTAVLSGLFSETLADQLPGIARQAIREAEGEIQDAREASGEPFPDVPDTDVSGFDGWATTVGAALIAAAVAAARDAQTVAGARATAVQAVEDGRYHTDRLANTAAARVVNEGRLATFRANSDIVEKLVFDAKNDSKTSEICRALDNADFNLWAENIPRPPLHNGCRSFLRPMTIKRKKGATQKELDRQNWAVFRRLEREAKKQAEGRAAPTEALERRFAPSVEAGTFTGYAVIWGELDRHGTVFARGAFDASLAEHRAEGHRLPMLWSHDHTRVVGAWTEVREDDTGLFVRGRLLIETVEGAGAYARLKAGALNGLSVGFRRLADEPRSGGGRIILRADLAEISLVAVPSGQRARVQEVRADHAAGAAPPHGGSTMEHDNGAAPETRADDTGTETGDLSGRVSALESRVDDIANDVAEIKSAVTATEKRADRLEARAGRAGVAPANDDGPPLEVRAFTAFVRRGRETMGADEIRSLTVADDTSGGFLAPPDFRAQVIQGIQQISPIRAHATVTSTSAGELVMPKLTGRPTAVWVGETEARSGTEPTFGQVTIPAHEASVYVDVSQKLLEDSAVNIVSELSGLLATEYARLEGVAFVSGDGMGKPRGVMTHADLPTFKNGSTSALSADKIIALMYAVKAAYRGRARWYMNGGTIAAVRSLKSGTSGEYLFKESLADGVPPTLLGKPVIEVPDMDDATSAKMPILFGDLKAAYRVVDRVGLSLLRDPYTQATSGLVRFHSRRRVGGDLVLPEAVKALVMST